MHIESSTPRDPMRAIPILVSLMRATVPGSWHRCWVVTAQRGDNRVQLFGKPEWSERHTVREALRKLYPLGETNGGWDHVRVHRRPGVVRLENVVRQAAAGQGEVS